MIETSIRERAALIRRVLRRVSAEMGRWWVAQWWASSCRARSIRSSSDVTVAGPLVASLAGPSLDPVMVVGTGFARWVLVLVTSVSVAVLRSFARVDTFDLRPMAEMAYSSPGPTSAQPMRRSGP
jgi:hypothetical protein